MKMIYDVVLEKIYDTYFSLRAFLLLENYYKLIIRNYLKNSWPIAVSRFKQEIQPRIAQIIEKNTLAF